MKKIILFDPSYGTSNLGDFIINEAIMNQMRNIFNQNILVRYSTHNPILHAYQMIRKNHIKDACTSADLKFLGGTNLIKKDLLCLKPGWNINPFTKNLYAGSICIGCGMADNSTRLNYYTKSIYNTALSKKYIHSARDEKTKIFLESLGLKAINTGCPTMWSLTQEHCKEIPQKKSDHVVFTLTDYAKDRENDQALIDALLKNYQNVYFWPQGTEDLEYFRMLNGVERVVVLGANLEAFKSLLTAGSIDYVGTRLHAGIYAMQHKVRSIILIVDNRARDIGASYGIKTIDRRDVAEIERMIKREFVTDVRIDLKKIDEWKRQFNEYGAEA